MNRLVLIGNGFDLAHNLPTSYQNFIDWYWEQRLNAMLTEDSAVSEDCLCKLEIKNTKDWGNWFIFFLSQPFRDFKTREWIYPPFEIISTLQDNIDDFSVKCSQFFERIIKSIETKGWVDVENEYYDLLKKYVLEQSDVAEIENLNKQLHFLQEKLVEYLKSLEVHCELLKMDIRQKIYATFEEQDISVEGQDALKEHVKSGLTMDNQALDTKFRQYGSNCYTSGFVDDFRNKYGNQLIKADELPKELLLPNHIMLLNFNYTHTADLYCRKGSIFSVNQIHGDLDNPSSIIFGYGDELDKDYKTIVDRNDNRFLGNIKSIKYLESDKYRRVLSFIESEPYQIIIMGHSCGNSDRTLLNTLFEHKNCVSIKPYYHKKKDGTDNYLELVQNISRNFSDMKLMRDRVVNKIYCNPLTEKLS